MTDTELWSLFAPRDWGAKPVDWWVPPQNRLQVNAANGLSYMFELRPLGAAMPSVPGVYVFTHLVAPASWLVDYVGESSDLGRRVGSALSDHHRVYDALRAGATHVAFMRVDGPEWIRLEIERSLVTCHQPVCNA